ncbi:hypothetical protein SPRG_06025 [Saprolegnia parasitica CBS 223.65]|uniref:Tubby C-terminal domain-containing protein n=1 Tax=Saprolegnia parasitica (strain CBS 223.65) TaxID=695850 RepID=A0A067CSH2_SAPPC|nr:hypothetical protein SPRG_06025 [Saprolegnia parasitica CBS 223.65]KDO29486.1 hypothetical protein SPRG_06025 [Saprolegnia parasitica CBS 223.65]|eukprot:XP_012199982.1 hypothetical protein SPRG_06025 [Saprolegnia parasitica CBS 223.65]
MNQRGAMAEEKWGTRRGWTDETAPPKSKFDAMMDEIGASSDNDDNEAAQAKGAALYVRKGGRKKPAPTTTMTTTRTTIRWVRVASPELGFDHVSPPLSVPAISMDLNALRQFVMRAPTKGSASVQCYVERDKSGTNLLRPVYRLFLEENKQFLLGAQVRSSRCAY